MPMNCPNCGAGTGADATSCAYCGSRLATVACPACLGSMFVGSQFCPHCGARAATVEDSGAQSLPCPGCTGEMQGVRVGDTAMHQCDQCGSAWLARETFEALCADRQKQGALAGALGDTPAPQAAETERPARYVKCPACQKIMNRVNFGRTSGVIVDVCKPHGVWFERDELRRVLAFTAHGGLEPHAGSGDGAAIARLKALNLYGGDSATVTRQGASFGITIQGADSSQVDATSLWATLFSSLFT
jgi:Zn-finger nucleic acid-binding protein